MKYLKNLNVVIAVVATVILVVGFQAYAVVNNPPPGGASGPGSSTDNAIARFDGAGGGTLQNSVLLIDDSGNLGVAADSDLLFLSSASLEVRGAVSISGAFSATVAASHSFIGDLEISDDASIANLFHVTEGNVGIGTASPEHTLDVSGNQRLVHTAVASSSHALELIVDAAGFGDIKAVDIDYISGAIVTGQDEAVMLINIDQISATGGEIFGLEVLSTEGSADQLWGLKVGVLIGPIHQDVGTFADPTTGTDNTESTDVAAMIDNNIGTTTAIFENDNEYILIGAVAAFQELEFIFATAGSKDSNLVFAYSISGAHTFTNFSPVDGTNGFQNNGIVSWDADDLVSHVANSNTSTFDIRITRTRNGNYTTPILGYARSAATTEYTWDLVGDISVNNASVSGAFEIVSGVRLSGTTIGIDADADLLQINSGGFEVRGTASISGDVQFNESAIFEIVAHGVSGATETLDWGAGNKQSVTLDENMTFSFTDPSNIANVIVYLLQDGSGTNTVAWPASVSWPGGSTPTITATGNAVDVVSCFFNNLGVGKTYNCVVSQDFQ